MTSLVALPRMSVAKMEDEERSAEGVAGLKLEDVPDHNGAVAKEMKSSTSTPKGSKPNSRASSVSPDAAKAASDSSSPSDEAPVSKPSRKTPNKVVREPPALFSHFPDVRDEAAKTYQVINDCLYGSRNMGSTEHDALDCDCNEDWRKCTLFF